MSFVVNDFVVELEKEQNLDLLTPLIKSDLIQVAQFLKLPVLSSMKKNEIKQLIDFYYTSEQELLSQPQSPLEPQASEAIELKRLELEMKKLEVHSQKEKDEFRLRELEIHSQKEKDEFRLRELEIHYQKEKDEFRLRELEMQSKIKLKELETQRRSTDALPNNNFDVTKHVRLVPPFQESEIDKYFVHFEKVAASLKWPKDVWTLLLQSVLKEKAQDIYSALSLEKSCNYDDVKDAILKSYELIPEAYRQKFRKYVKNENLTFVEFAREKQYLFDRWCHSKRRF